MTRSSPSPLVAPLRGAPLTVGIAIASIVASVYWWMGNDVSGWVLEVSGDAWQPWRYLASTLLHINLIHMAFNVAWLGYFGVVIERAFGSGRFLAMVVLFAAGSSAAEFALSRGGLGLSGVVYGLFGLLWVLGRRDDRFRGVVGALVTWLFIGWFFLCILTTATGTFVVSNFAHAGGAILGGLMGAALTAPASTRVRWGSLLAGCFLLFFLGSAVARPYINLSSEARSWELVLDAYDALVEEDFERSVELYQGALELRPHDGDSWYNLGYAYMQMHRFDEAVAALERAVDLTEHDSAHRRVLAWNRAWARSQEAYLAYSFDEFERSKRIYREALAFDESIPQLWHGLGLALSALGRYEEAAEAFRRALDLAPSHDEYRRAAEWADAEQLARLAYERLLEEDYERSVILYRRALRSDESMPEWWYNLGVALLNLDRLREAHTALTRALILDPDDVEVEDLLAWIEEVETAIEDEGDHE